MFVLKIFIYLLLQEHQIHDSDLSSPILLIKFFQGSLTYVDTYEIRVQTPIYLVHVYGLDILKVPSK